MADVCIPLGVFKGQRGSDFNPERVPSVAMSSEPINGFEVGFDDFYQGFHPASTSLFQGWNWFAIKSPKKKKIVIRPAIGLAGPAEMVVANDAFRFKLLPATLSYCFVRDLFT